MKVILLKDVARLGRRGEMKEVPSGHAQNFLFPRKLAQPATPENMKRAAEHVSKREEMSHASEESFAQALVRLSGMQVEMSVTANEQGHLFRGVKVEDIVRTLQEQGIFIPHEAIILPHPIKVLGVHEVKLVMGNKEGILMLSLIKN